MHQAGLKVGLAEGTLDGPVILAGAFDEDDDVVQLMVGGGLPDVISMKERALRRRGSPIG
jgi:hypothetical protein